MSTRPLIDLIDEEEFPLEVYDELYVSNKDSDYHYAWLHKKPDNLERMKAIFGWEILGSQHDEVALVPPNALGERVHGDVVLARMPRERYEKLQRIKQRRSADALLSASEEWKAAVENAGLKADDSTTIDTRVLNRKP